MDKGYNLSNPSVCIGIPVKNGAKTIKATLKSIINQEYKNIKIVVCDNNSTDQTRVKVENFAIEEKIDIHYILNTSDKGVGENNWNYLLKNISRDYDYYALFHADDIYDSKIISEQVKMIQKTGVGAVFCTARLIDENGNDISKKKNHNILLPKEIKEVIFDYNTLLNYTLKYYNFIKAPSFFFQKEILINGFLFDTQFKSSGDLDMWLRIAEKYKIAIINNPYLLYRISKSQGTYVLSIGKETQADYFTVMDYHISKCKKINSKFLKRYNCYRSMNMITQSLNLIKNNKSKEAYLLLNQAVNFNNIPYLIHIYRGIWNFILGLSLKIAINFGFEKKLIELIKR